MNVASIFFESNSRDNDNIKKYIYISVNETRGEITIFCNL